MAARRRSIAAWAALAALTLATCSGEGGDKADTGAADGSDADVTSDATAACAAVRAVRLAELPGGAGLLTGPQAAAGGDPLDVVLDNAHARFVIRGGERGVAIEGSRGGGVVDAALITDGAGDAASWRERTSAADDLREIAVTVGFYLVRPDEVTILDDGCDGVARVRVRGPLVPFPTLQDTLGAAAPQVVAEHVYELHPERGALTIRTVIGLAPEAKGGKTSVLVADVLFWGGEVAMYLPGYGDHDLPTTTQAATVGLTPRRLGGAQTAGATDGAAAYAFATEKKLSTVDAGAIHAFLHGNSEVVAGEATVVTRALAVGADLAAAMATARRAIDGEAAEAGLRAIRGKVSGPRPAATIVEVFDAKAKPLTRCACDADGAFACDVPTDAAALRSGWIGDGGRGLGGAGQTDAASELALTPGSEALDDLVLAPPRPAELRIKATSAGAPLPVRVTLRPNAPGAAKSQRRVFADVDGSATHLVPPGSYMLWLHHGPTFNAHERQVELVAGEATDVVIALAQRVDTKGWVAMDSHVHAEQSSDSTVPVELRLGQAAAEGLHYVIATDHDHVTDYRDWIDHGADLAAAPAGCDAVAVGKAGALVHTAAGIEVSTIKQGHFNAWPAAPVAWYQLGTLELFAAMGAGQPGRVVQCNHPLFETYSFFGAIGFDAATTPVSTLQCDVIEVLNGIDHKATSAVFAAWMALLDRGIFLVAVGTSDCHGDGDFLGNPRTWVRVAASASDACGPSAAAVDAALKAGAAIASAGPLLWLRAESGGETAEIGELLRVHGKGTLRARVQAPAWLPLGRLEVWIDGVRVADVDLSATEVVDGARDAVVELALAATPTDGFATAIHYPGAPADPGTHRPSWAVANPIFFDGDGDGLWHGAKR